MSPIETAQVATLTPTLTVSNVALSTAAIHTETLGTTFYVFQISESDRFEADQRSFNYPNIPEGPGGKTSFTVTIPLKANTIYFWRVYATDGALVSVFSRLESFRTVVTLSAPTPVSPIGGSQILTIRPTFTFTNSTASSGVGTVVYSVQVSESSTFPANSTTGSFDNIAQGAGGTTTFAMTTDLRPNAVYFWRIRGSSSIITSDFSRVETFKTVGNFRNGNDIRDDLLSGTTQGIQNGGHFVPGRGWMSDSLSDSIIYDLATACVICTVEFDITNIGSGEGGRYQKDLTFLAMGDRTLWGGLFRDSPFKMHLRQKGGGGGSDGDGSGLENIWRNGCGDLDGGACGSDDLGDHRVKLVYTDIPWGNSQVIHFKFQWDTSGFTITINGAVYFQAPFRPGNPYAPPNMRVELGGSARAESFIGIIYSNFRMTPF